MSVFTHFSRYNLLAESPRHNKRKEDCNASVISQ